MNQETGLVQGPVKKGSLGTRRQGWFRDPETRKVQGPGGGSGLDTRKHKWFRDPETGDGLVTNKTKWSKRCNKNFESEKAISLSEIYPIYIGYI